MRPLMDTTRTGSSVAVLPDAESLSVAAATVIVAEARRAVKRTGRFTIALSGGATPQPVYELLAQPPFADLVPWEATHVFWGDERCVEPRRPAQQRADGPPGSTRPRAHPRRSRCIRCDVPGGRAGAPPRRRAANLRPASRPTTTSGCCGASSARGRLGGGARGGPAAGGRAAPAGTPGGLDLVLLGIGENGHTASLFPGSEVLHEQERWAAAAYEDPVTAAATTGTGERLWRVTLTAPFINRAALVVFVVSGASKAAVVKEAIQGDPDPRRSTCAADPACERPAVVVA